MTKNNKSKIGRIWNEVIRRGFFHRMKIPSEPDKSFEWTIYGDNIKYSEWKKRWHHLHATMKYRIVYPFFKLFDIVYGRHRIDKPRPKEWHDANMVAFQKALKYCIEKYVKDPTLKKIFYMVEHWSMTMVIQDTAYRELFNMWMVNLAVQINRIRKDIPKVLKGGRDLISEAFETSWVEAKIDWIKYYLKTGSKPSDEEIYMILKDSPGLKVSQSVKNAAQNFILNQTFGQVFMREFILRVVKEVDKANQFNSVAHHLIYSSKGMTDRQYYVMGNAMMEEKLTIRKLTEGDAGLKDSNFVKKPVVVTDRIEMQSEALELEVDAALAKNEKKRIKENLKEGIKPILCK